MLGLLSWDEHMYALDSKSPFRVYLTTITRIQRRLGRAVIFVIIFILLHNASATYPYPTLPCPYRIVSHSPIQCLRVSPPNPNLSPGNNFLERPLGLLSKLLPRTLCGPRDQEPVTVGLVLLCAAAEIAKVADEQHVLQDLLGDLVAELGGGLDAGGLLDELDGLARDGAQGVDDVLRVDPLAGALDGDAVGALAGLEQPDGE